MSHPVMRTTEIFCRRLAKDQVDEELRKDARLGSQGAHYQVRRLAAKRWYSEQHYRHRRRSHVSPLSCRP